MHCRVCVVQIEVVLRPGEALRELDIILDVPGHVGRVGRRVPVRGDIVQAVRAVVGGEVLGDLDDQVGGMCEALRTEEE